MNRAGRGTLSLKARAIAWLSQREHSRAELERKLLAFAQQRRDEEPAGSEAPTSSDGANDIPALLDWLEARGYLSDRRYAESRLRVRSARYGLQRLQYELSQQGVALDDDLRRDLRDSEFDRARQLAQRRFGTARTASAAKTADAANATGEAGGTGADGGASEATNDATREATHDATRKATHDADRIDAAERARRLRYLISRGFSQDVARRALNAIAQDGTASDAS